jgi:hypothetical protein
MLNSESLEQKTMTRSPSLPQDREALKPCCKAFQMPGDFVLDYHHQVKIATNFHPDKKMTPPSQPQFATIWISSILE